MSKRVSRKVHVGKGRDGRREIRRGEEPDLVVSTRPSRQAELLALAHVMIGMLTRGEVKTQTELARLSGVSCARITQIMKLLDLPAPVQEQILLGELPNLSEKETVRRAAAGCSWR